jgi:hypothetical protein
MILLVLLCDYNECNAVGKVQSELIQKVIVGEALIYSILKRRKVCGGFRIQYGAKSVLFLAKSELSLRIRMTQQTDSANLNGLRVRVTNERF